MTWAGCSLNAACTDACLLIWCGFYNFFGSPVRGQPVDDCCPDTSLCDQTLTKTMTKQQSSVLVTVLIQQRALIIGVSVAAVVLISTARTFQQEARDKRTVQHCTTGVGWALQVGRTCPHHACVYGHCLPLGVNVAARLLRRGRCGRVEKAAQWWVGTVTVLQIIRHR